MGYPIIVALCYIIVALIRKTVVKNEWLPVISCGCGAGLALLGYFAFPTLIVAATWYAAIIGGAVSGLAATGGNQVFKQAVKLICAEHNINYETVEPVANQVDAALQGDTTPKE